VFSSLPPFPVLPPASPLLSSLPVAFLPSSVPASDDLPPPLFYGASVPFFDDSDSDSNDGNVAIPPLLPSKHVCYNSDSDSDDLPPSRTISSMFAPIFIFGTGSAISRNSRRTSSSAPTFHLLSVLLLSLSSSRTGIVSAALASSFLFYISNLPLTLALLLLFVVRSLTAGPMRAT
jgi:hypothetical protein